MNLENTIICNLIDYNKEYIDVEFLSDITQNTSQKYVFINTSIKSKITISTSGIKRMKNVASATNSLLTYCDYQENNLPHRTNDYHEGCIRDDFNFGPLILLQIDAIKKFIELLQVEELNYSFSILYALRLFISRQGKITHIPEILYSCEPIDLRLTGEKIFDYVNPSQKLKQKENEIIVTDHLKKIEAWLPHNLYKVLPKNKEPETATVIIPVFNRVKTIKDAIESVLSQQSKYTFNLIIVDNHSTDGTSDIIKKYVKAHHNIIHLIPKENNLGIGGCWNTALNHPQCGKYAIQLDSDDLYAHNNVIEQIVEKFIIEKSAMVIGAYEIVDFNLQTIPPGLITHDEWTVHNGRNNALRINGFGAPRAFRSDIAREIGFPNTSYGEDYAIALNISMFYPISRIYDSLYLCRRWNGNSDAKLSIEQTNTNNYYKDHIRYIEILARKEYLKQNLSYSILSFRTFFSKQLESWDAIRKSYLNIKSIEKKVVKDNTSAFILQHNPKRITSTGASIDEKDIQNRDCFLCSNNRPKEQIVNIQKDIEILINPYPILPIHLTIVSKKHSPQYFRGILQETMNNMASKEKDFLFFYNGAHAGASAPDHAHIQAGTKGCTPIEKNILRYITNKIPLKTDPNKQYGIFIIQEYCCPFFLLIAHNSTEMNFLQDSLLQNFNEGVEPDMNVLTWNYSDNLYTENSLISTIFIRKKHRPICYGIKNEQYLISPGALDMAGLIICPLKKDFEAIDGNTISHILSEVSLSKKEFSLFVNSLIF